mgnify:CR=1 FL=1
MSQPQHLKPDLNLTSLFFLSFGTIIGVGWITVMGDWLADAGPIGAVIAFVAGASVVILISLCYAEIGAMYPVSGGEVAYVYRLYGSPLAFLCGWLLSLHYIALLGFEAISVGWVLSAMFPGLEGPVVYSILGSDVRLYSLLIGIAVMVALAIVQYASVRSVGRLQSALTISLLIASAAFVLAGIGFGDPANLEPHIAQDDSGSFQISGVAFLFATTFFWFAGFDVIPQAMGEKSESARLDRMQWVMISSISLALLFYVAVILATAMAAPRNVILATELPVAGAFQAAFGTPWLKNLVLAAGLMGILSTWNACFLAGTRLLYSLGRAHFIPAYFSDVNSRHATPTKAILFAGVIGGMLAFFGRDAIGVIVNVSAISLSFVFLLVTFGVARLRKTAPDFQRPYKVPFGVLIPYLAAAGSALILAIAIWSLSDFSDGVPLEWFMLGSWLAIGALFWVLSAKMRKSVEEAERTELILGTNGDV